MVGSFLGWLVLVFAGAASVYLIGRWNRQAAWTLATIIVLGALISRPAGLDELVRFTRKVRDSVGSF